MDKQMKAVLIVLVLFWYIKTQTQVTVDLNYHPENDGSFDPE